MTLNRVLGFQTSGRDASLLSHVTSCRDALPSLSTPVLLTSAPMGFTTPAPLPCPLTSLGSSGSCEGGDCPAGVLQCPLPPGSPGAHMGSSSSQCQVELNRKVLADLAIYEPKTFKSLAALAKRRRQEGFAAALGDGKEPEGIFSRVVRYH